MTGRGVILHFNEIRMSKRILRKGHRGSSSSPLIQDHSRNFSPPVSASSPRDVSPWHAIKDLRDSFTQNYSAVCIITPDTRVRDTWRFFAVAYQVSLILISRREVRRGVYTSGIDDCFPLESPHEAIHMSPNCQTRLQTLRILIIRCN